jgi:pimeloyl-ACP methyl ester carboxylesterase
MRWSRLGSIVFLSVLLFGGASRSSAMLESSFLYFPSHSADTHGLTAWRIDDRLIGYAHLAPAPKRIWLMCHGNGGQASQRDYVLGSLPPGDSLYILEYPGYGERPGKPSMRAINAAALEAFHALKKLHPTLPLGIIGESLGSGPSSYLCTLADAPDRLVLIVPFDRLVDVAKEHIRFLPVSWLMRDKWDNISALKNYRGTIDIFGATRDTIIPIHHAKALAASLPSARFHEMDCDHNDWSSLHLVKIEP